VTKAVLHVDDDKRATGWIDDHSQCWGGGH